MDKRDEPPVIAISEDGKSVVPLLGGHHGANDLARRLAVILDGHAAITTAGDLRFGIALDEPPAGWTLVNPENAKSVMAGLLAGQTVCMEGSAGELADWIENSTLEIGSDGDICLFMTTRRAVPLKQTDLMFVPRIHVLGMGCERGAGVEEAIALCEDMLRANDIHKSSLACVASIDLKADEAAIHAVADHFGVPAVFLDATRLEEEAPRLQNPSEIVFAEVGCHGVAEGCRTRWRWRVRTARRSQTEIKTRYRRHWPSGRSN